MAKRLIPGTGGYADEPPPRTPKKVTFFCEDCREMLPWKQAPAHLHGRPALWLVGLDLRDEDYEPAFVGVPRRAACSSCEKAIPALYAHLHDTRECLYVGPLSAEMEAWLVEVDTAQREGRMRPPFPQVAQTLPPKGRT